MMKKFLKFLLYLFIILLVSALVIVTFVLMQWPIEQAFVTLAFIFGIFFSVVILRKLYVRYRARAQVKRVISTGKSEAADDLGMTPSQLVAELKRGWRTALTRIKKSNLRLKGDPLYVLPWYMVIGKPRSGKSTALKNARLLSPDIDLPKQGEGSTLNLDWWLYEQAIVIDTAGRYAVPDEAKRDKKEWSTLLTMLSRHKQKEPINGIVLAVSADRLLQHTDEDLLEEGRQVRASISELMEKLEIKVPVYLMITKCDLIEGFNEWVDYLPEKAALQAMGHLHEAEGFNIEQDIDQILDALLYRIKQLRVLMLERRQSHPDELLTFPANLEGLRTGLKVFVHTALKENPYQDTPRFRGLFFTSSQYKNDNQGQLQNRGLFLHEFFSRVLPADRDLLDSLPSALRLRRAVKAYSLSIGGAVTFVALAFITILYNNDMATLKDIEESYPEINIQKKTVNDRLYELYSLRSLILDLEEAQSEWMIPWHGRLGELQQTQALKLRYIEALKLTVLDELDTGLTLRLDDLAQTGTSSLAGGLIRRINLLSARLSEKPQQEDENYVPLDEKPPVQADYIKILERSVNREPAEIFNDLYISYLEWNTSKPQLLEEKAQLQNAFIVLIERNHGDYSWIIDWANQQDNPHVQLSDFWGGSVKLADPVRVDSAYTLAGREFIVEFLNELSEASNDDTQMALIKADFELFYKRRYIQAWTEFAKNFDQGKLRLRGRREWVTAVDTLSTKDNPYFRLMERVVAELEPLEVEEEFEGKEMFDFFVEMQEFTGAATVKKGSNKAAVKLGLKILGKMGPIGKQLAKAGKTSLKEKKKLDKGKPKGPAGPDLDDAVEKGSESLVAYKKALADVAFNSESKKQSYDAINALFNESGGAGDGAPGEAVKAIDGLQRVSGKPRPSTALFWKLYTGPMGLVYDFMEYETNCRLQDAWQEEVLSQVEGVSQNKVGKILIGEAGLIWQYVNGTANQFLIKRAKSGYIPRIADKRKMQWQGNFLEFINHADEGRFIVESEFTVKIDTLPTGVNIGATIAPYATFLELHCADGVQTLANYNYADGHDFKWSLEKCGDVSLRIEIGHIRLSKQYTGVKGFSKFLADFHDGRRVFLAEEFPNQAAQLKNEFVRAIDVSYEIRGQEPVVQILESVPLQPPARVTQCW